MPPASYNYCLSLHFKFFPLADFLCLLRNGGKKPSELNPIIKKQIQLHCSGLKVMADVTPKSLPG